MLSVSDRDVMWETGKKAEAGHEKKKYNDTTGAFLGNSELAVCLCSDG